MALQVWGFFEALPREGPCGPFPWRVLEDPPRRGVPLVYVVAATALPPMVIIEEIRAWDHLHLSLGAGPDLQPPGEVWIWALLAPRPGESPTLATQLRPPMVLVPEAPRAEVEVSQPAGAEQAPLACRRDEDAVEGPAGGGTAAPEDAASEPAQPSTSPTSPAEEPPLGRPPAGAAAVPPQSAPAAEPGTGPAPSAEAGARLRWKVRK